MNSETYGEALRNARVLARALESVEDSTDGRLALLVVESSLWQLTDRVQTLRRQVDAAI